jgi:hypothetical protein
MIQRRLRRKMRNNSLVPFVQALILAFNSKYIARELDQTKRLRGKIMRELIRMVCIGKSEDSCLRTHVPLTVIFSTIR